MFAAFLHSVLTGLSSVESEIQMRTHTALATLADEQAMVHEMTGAALNSKLFSVPYLDYEVDVRVMIMSSVVVWAALFSAFWMVPSLVRLQSKRTVDNLGVVGAQVETVDRLVAIVHAAVATVFGIIAWQFYFFYGIGNVTGLTAAGVASATYPAWYLPTLRVGTAITLGYIVYDFAVIIVIDGIYGVRKVSWDMVIHHCVIIPLCLAALSPGGLGMESILWFLTINLINEFSTIFLHMCKFAKELGYDKELSFKVIGGLMMLSFFVCRCVVISLTLLFMGMTKACGLTPGKATFIYFLVGVHWLLNLYWFVLIMKLIFRASKRESVAPPVEEAAPLLADASGLSTDGAPASGEPSTDGAPAS